MTAQFTLFLEPQQEAEVAPLLRDATLSGRGVLAGVLRTPHGIRLDLATFSRAKWLRLLKIIEETE